MPFIIFRPWRRLGAGAAMAALLAGAAPAVADPAPPFSVLLRQAQTAAPRLAESAAGVRAAQGQADQAGARPNPTLGFEAENLAVHDTTGVAARQDTLSVSQALELGGKRSARIAAGQAGVDASEARRAMAAADFAAGLAETYAAAEAAGRRAALLDDDLARAREDVRAVEALVKAGKEADLRASQARAAASGAEADLEAARADTEEALARLSSLAGATTPFTGVTVSLLDRAESLPLPAPEPPATMPAVQAARAEREAATRRIAVEQSRAAPDVTLSLGARRYEGLAGAGVVAGISAPLPLFDRNRGSIAPARAERDAAEARLDAARLDAEANWRGAAAQARAGAGRLKAALEAQAAAGETYRLARIGYDAGKASLLELLSARRADLDARSRVLDARLARIRAEASLARLAGRIPFGDPE